MRGGHIALTIQIHTHMHKATRGERDRFIICTHVENYMVQSWGRIDRERGYTNRAVSACELLHLAFSFRRSKDPSLQ